MKLSNIMTTFLLSTVVTLGTVSVFADTFLGDPKKDSMSTYEWVDYVSEELDLSTEQMLHLEKVFQPLQSGQNTPDHEIEKKLSIEAVNDELYGVLTSEQTEVFQKLIPQR